MPGLDTNIGAKRARTLRAELGLRPDAPVACILTAVEEWLGIPVVVAALPEGIAGCCWRDGSRVVLWVNGVEAPVRQRFTLAHELGHLRCGHEPHVPVDTVETIAGKTAAAPEIQANAFAAELLAPAAGVRALVAGEANVDDVVRVAARYGISAIAALYRLITLRLTTRPGLLKHELEEGHQEDVARRLTPPPFADALARIGHHELPRLSPILARSALAASAVPAAEEEPVQLVHRLERGRQRGA